MAVYAEPERIHLKNHPEYNEKRVQAKIAEDLVILGLGDDLVLIQQERIQPTHGRLEGKLSCQFARKSS